MKPSNRNNRADIGYLDGWYGYRHNDTHARFVWAVFGNLTAAFDGEQLFIRIGCGGQKAGA